MQIHIAQDEFRGIDRSGVADQSRAYRQGFYVGFSWGTLEFEDEEDAVKMAKAILLRMGYEYQPLKSRE